MFSLDQLIDFWTKKQLNRLAGTMSSPDPWIEATLRSLKKLRSIDRGTK